MTQEHDIFTQNSLQKIISHPYLVFAVYVHFPAVKNLPKQHLVASQSRQMQLNVGQRFFLQNREERKGEMKNDCQCNYTTHLRQSTSLSACDLIKF